MLESARSLNLRPPSSLWWTNLSHNFQCIFFVFLPNLHQNCATGLINFFVTWFCKAMTTDFIINSFPPPPFVMNLKVHLFTMLFSRSWMKLNIAFLIHPYSLAIPDMNPSNLSYESLIYREVLLRIGFSIMWPNWIDFFFNLLADPTLSHNPSISWEWFDIPLYVPYKKRDYRPQKEDEISTGVRKKKMRNRRACPSNLHYSTFIA